MDWMSCRTAEITLWHHLWLRMSLSTLINSGRACPQVTSNSSPICLSADSVYLHSVKNIRLCIHSFMQHNLPQRLWMFNRKTVIGIAVNTPQLGKGYFYITLLCSVICWLGREGNGGGMFGRMILTSSVHYCDLDPRAVSDHSEFYKNCRSHDLLE